MANNTERRDLRGELERDDGTYASAWKPDEGDVLVGGLVGYSTGPSAYGDVTIAEVEEEETGKRWAVWLSRTVLRNEFAQQQPKPGERIALKFYGQPHGANYFKYKLIIDRPTEVPNFEESATEDEPPGDFKLAKREARADDEPPPLEDDDSPF